MGEGPCAIQSSQLNFLMVFSSCTENNVYEHFNDLAFGWYWLFNTFDFYCILFSFFSSTQTRARLSFKRRLPTRQHRRSAGEDEGSSPCELNSPIENGDEEAVLKSPAEEEEEEKDGFSGRLDKGRDKVGFCKKTEDKLEKINPGCEGDPEKEPHAQQSQDSKAAEEEEEEELRPSERCPSNQENVNNTRIAEGMQKEN